MKVSLKRIVCIALSVVSVLSVTSCGKKGDKPVTIEKMEPEKAAKVTFDFLGGADVMPLSGYYGPYVLDYSKNGDTYPDYISDDIMKKISDCGINVMHYCGPTYQTTRKELIKLLELGEKYNVGIFACDSEVTTMSYQGNNDKENDKYRAKFLARYGNYPSLCGFYMMDEPTAPYYMSDGIEWRTINSLSTMSQTFKRLGLVPAINLLPPVTEEDYQPWNKYVQEYIDLCSPQFLSYDCYPYISYGNKDVFFYSLDRMTHYAKENDIPLWTYIQAGDESERGFGTYDPDEGEYFWNINTCLAFGAKGLEYYMVIQPHYFAAKKGEDYDRQQFALIGSPGNKTQWWYMTQRINNHIKSIDSVLMNSTHKGMLATGEKSKKQMKGLEVLIKGDGWRELKSVEGDTIIGCFNYQGKTALYVVNIEEAYAQNVVLNLQGTYNMSVTQNAEVKTVRTNKLKLDLKAGEGALIVFD